MKYLLLISAFSSLFLFITNKDFKTNEQVKPRKEKTITLNPLDKILGEHYYDNGSIRKDNFDSILNISARHLFDSSEHYHVIELKENLFFLKRKKFYLDNRRYSLIVETKQHQIVAVHPFVDLDIKDALSVDDKLYLIQGDYTEIASHWWPTYSIKISCLDSTFTELWNVSSIPNKGAFFLGYNLRLDGDQIIAGFGVQREGSSTMCVSDYVVMLSKNGKIDSFHGAGGYSCGSTPSVPVTVLHELFK